jgi:hypothetical protein
MALVQWSNELASSEALDASGLEFSTQGFMTEFVPPDGSKLGFTFTRCITILNAHNDLPRQLEIKYDDIHRDDPTAVVTFELSFDAFKGSGKDRDLERGEFTVFCDVMDGGWYSIGPDLAKGYAIPKEDKRLFTRFNLPLKSGIRRLSEARGKSLVVRMLKVAMMKEA